MSGTEPGVWLDIWLDADGPGRARRTPLERGLTRIGGGDAEVPLGVLGADQLHVWNHPPRVLFVGGGPKPTCGGAAFEERALVPGERVQWAGHTLLLGGDEAPARAPARNPGASAGRTPARERVARRQPQATSVGLGSFLVMQVASFLLFSLLVAAILVALRIKGLSVDRLIDRLLERVLPG